MAKGKPKEEEKSKQEEKKKDEKEEKKRPDIRRDIPSVIIRVAGTDLDGEKTVMMALRKIRGIGVVMSKAISLGSKLDPVRKLKDLNEKEIANLENVIKNPINFGVPSFLVNRRKDMETGANMHLTSSDLEIAKRFDIQRYLDLKTYRGIRHMLGQPVRGQRTRSSFRKTGMAVGVLKKAAAAPGAAPAAGAAAPAPAGKAPSPAAKPAAGAKPAAPAKK